MAEAFKGRNQDRQEFKVVGRRDIPGRLSYTIATGAAKFAREVVRPDMLHGKILRSPYGRARIKHMDTSKAKALPGVKAVVTWEDKEVKAMPFIYFTPPVKGFPQPFTSSGVPVLSNEAEREGDEVGVCVAAESEETCHQALKLIDLEWEVLPHVLDPREALEQGAPKLQPALNPGSNVAEENNWEIGDVEAGFREADHVIEYDRAFPLINNHKPNPFTMVAWWEQDPLGSEGESLFIEGDTFLYLQSSVMEAFNLPEDKIHWLTMYCGGQYCDVSPRRLAVLTPLLAKRTGRPVRIAYTRRDNFDIGGGAQLHTHLKIGFNDDGMLTTAQGRIVSNAGTRASLPAAFLNSIDALKTAKCTSLKNETKAAYTNTVRLSFDPSQPYTWEVLTTAIWRIADVLDMDPTEVALKNCHTPEPSLKLCIEKGKAAIGWDEKWHSSGTKRLPNGRMHGMGFRYHDAPRHSHARYCTTIAIKSDGKVYVPHRGPWRGVYCEDACAMVIAEELGARLEDVIIQYDPHASATTSGGGSDGGAASTWVAKEAAIELKALLLKNAAALLRVTPEELDTRDSSVYFKAIPEKSYKFAVFATDVVIGGQRDLVVSYTGMPPMDIWMTSRYEKLRTMNATFCEVEVDTETGELEITNWVAACDVGKAIRPSSVEGQIEGQLIMNTGYAKMEGYIWDNATGVLLNGNDIEYKLPTLLDVPPIDPIVLETRLGSGCYGATGISHQVVDKAIVACAVHNAIGKWIDDIPMTPDKILKALGKI
jgi:CO/xanthine dehydrogenase Mo-binding subunit